ncbi:MULTISPECIES: DUF5675 family protein [unclassified Gilliamella]|uniref:DUF5675 family protein n=1 Tax=unclassified Gilliamella TaxID=2685620 RepID=UPI0013297E7E|nr:MULTISPECIES: DUF5675 family protein [unclassified Gilliamella]MWN30999.1 hypothetical protein [Gilliamella sp. Pra-s60]MWP28436.1 hypothetical protein [Gilliamella sp. Pra-s54]
MKLTRLKTSEHGTFGKLQLPSGTILSTLELLWKDNQRQISCIPVAIYQCDIVNSPKFGRVYQVKDVPNRSHILIHAGNWTKDTQGCILVGMSNNDTQLFESKKALNLLMSELNGQSFKLEIIEAYE